MSPVTLEVPACDGHILTLAMYEFGLTSTDIHYMSISHEIHAKDLARLAGHVLEFTVYITKCDDLH